MLQVRPPSHEQLAVFHFSSDVLGSSGVVSLCETQKSPPKIATPSAQSFWRLVADCRGLSTVSCHGELESVSDRARLSSLKKNKIAWKVLSRDLCLARWKLCYTSLSSFLSGSKQPISVPLPTDLMVFLPEGYILNLTKRENEFSGSCQPKKQQDIPSHPTAIESKTRKNHQARTETWMKHEQT